MGQQTDTPKDCRTKGGANSSEPPLFSPQDIRRFEEIHAQAPHLYPPHMDSRMSGQNTAHAFASWMAGFTQPQPDLSAAESTWRFQFAHEMEQMGAMLRASQHENARLRIEIQLRTPGLHTSEEDGPAGRQTSTKEDGPAGRKAASEEDGPAGRQASTRRTDRRVGKRTDQQVDKHPLRRTDQQVGKLPIRRTGQVADKDVS